MRTCYRNLRDGIANLIKWFLIIWNDRDWDWYYLVVIIQYKIKRMEKYHRTYKGFVGVEKTIKQLNICKNLLKRIEKDDYILNLRYDSLLKINRSRAYKWVKDYEMQDMNLLTNIMCKHLKYWWD